MSQVTQTNDFDSSNRLSWSLLRGKAGPAAGAGQRERAVQIQTVRARAHILPIVCAAGAERVGAAIRHADGRDGAGRQASGG